MNTTEKLELILESPRLKEFSKNFAGSMLEQSKKKDLSDKQLEYVQKFWDECFPDQSLLIEEEQWISSFTEEMKLKTKIMGEYYRCHYNLSKFGKASVDESYIPTKEIYERNVESQWAQRIVTNYMSQPRFIIGDLCILRDTAKNRSSYGKQVGKPLLILDFDKNVKNEFNIFYKVIDLDKIEDQKDFSLREDMVNKYKEKKS